LKWLNENKEIHPIIKAGLFHYQFETIHPFTDGNGRTGRLLALLHLYQSEWDFKKILVLEDYYNRNRKAYYEALQTGETYQTRKKADLTNWLEYFAAGFLDEAKRVKDQVLSLSVIGDIKATRNTLNKDELQIVDFIVTMGQITSNDVVDILKIPKRTAQAKLKKLEDVKVLKKVGSGPATHYVVSEVDTYSKNPH
jgi:Fic family protein